jgi:hypothetical protein
MYLQYTVEEPYLTLSTVEYILGPCKVYVEGQGA